MRIVRHTENQFAAEEKPLASSVLFALFGLASVLLVAEALTRGGGWQTIAAALFFAVTGYFLFSVERVWLVLDREANAADLQCGRENVLISVDALMRAEVRKTAEGHALCLATAVRDLPVIFPSRDDSPARLMLVAAELNAWLKGQPVPATAESAAPMPAPMPAPMLDSAPILT